ncbi:chemotaxis protein CheY [Bacillus sp. LL01]|uniref:response regulator n=1 Tax=Bacillus sp. LL01 TaxID=1665556 RepID=UPI00064CF661|nr:response regulator [Bacillus sp. LL01]KMJ57754.1 chemotaxis protein CheY [Bacillus sp. LL01]
MARKEMLIKVLLIEDDPMVQHVNKLFIEKIDGFVVSGVASSGVEGKKLIKELQPDLVLLDVYMPGQDGLSLIQELRHEQIDVDIIAVTAANDTNTVKVFMRNGVIDYIVKPFTFERMEKAFLQYKEVYRQLYRESAISQDKWDEVMASAKKEPISKGTDKLPKGLQEQTLNQIYKYVIGLKEAKSAEEIGKKVGLARVTARRYLSYLESVGKVEMELTYGTIGRPIQTYRFKG